MNVADPLYYMAVQRMDKYAFMFLSYSKAFLFWH